MIDSPYDIFISYRHSDVDDVRPMATALQSTGLRVWIDETRIEDFKSIQGNIENGLAKSKALLAWYSTRYPESRACQWELTAAFLAAQQEGDVRKRILLVNPENSNTHIYPVELRDALYRSAPDADADRLALAAAISAHVAQLAGVVGEIRSLARPTWYGRASGDGSNRFVGRVHELWEIHSGLQAAARPVVTGSFARPLVRLVGMGGAGKSLLAEEYALRFGAAYPGGIFWLKAFGHDNARSMKAEEREAERQRQFADLAESLDISTRDLTPTRIRAQLISKLEQRGACLWVVDDLPSAISWDEAQAWMVPAQGGHMLVTTRTGAHDWAGKLVEIVELEPDVAYTLLTYRRPPRDEREESEARSLANDLGYHALTLELAAVLAERRGYTDVRRRLADRSKDVLDFAVELFGARGGTLPHREGVNISVSHTLLISIEMLKQGGMDFLRLAAQLAPVPISRKLVALAFAAGDGTSARDAEDRAELALTEVESNSLVRAASETAVVVHTLVSRTVRFRDHAQDRQRTLRRGAADALARIIQPQRGWQGELASDVDHARTVILAMVEGGPGLNKDEVRSLVMLLQQIYPYTDEVGVLWQKALEICRRVLGEQDPNTLIAMNRRAVWLYGLGDPDEALEMQDKVLELSRAIRGDEHADTRIAMQNLLETLRDLMYRFKSHDPKECSAKLQALLKQRDALPGRATGPSTLMNNPV